jgi:hypothetical protein
MPDLNIAPPHISLSSEIPPVVVADVSVRNDHTPPPFDTGASPLNLRI